jgi:hypothetical protein
MRNRFVGAGLGVALGAVVAVSAWAEQPKMRDALEHLQAARAALQDAKENKGGHRENAIELVNRAIEQVQKGMEHARDE